MNSNIDKNRRFFFIFLISISSLPLISVLLPRAMTFAPAIIGLIFYLFIVLTKKEKISLNKQYIIIAAIITAICTTSSLWSEHSAEVLIKSLKTAAVLFGNIFIISLCMKLPSLSQRYSININSMAWIFPAMLTLAALLASEELFMAMPLYRIAHNFPADYHFNTSVINRGAVNIVLCSFAAISMIRFWNADKWKKWSLGVIMISSILLMLSLTQAQSAQLAFAVGVFTYIAFPHSWKRAYTALAVIITILFMSAPWLSQYTFSHLASDVNSSSWLSQGYAANRMEIWDFVSRYGLEKPILGHGMEATRYVESFNHQHLYHKEDSVLHPHNAIIQIWVEFGLVGSLIFCAILIYVINSISRLPKENARTAISLFLSTMVIASISYGLWQSHWIGVILYVLEIGIITSAIIANSTMGKQLHTNSQ